MSKTFQNLENDLPGIGLNEFFPQNEVSLEFFESITLEMGK